MAINFDGSSVRALSAVLMLCFGSHLSSSDRTDPSRSTIPTVGRGAPADTSFMSRFVGCYGLQIDGARQIELRLLPTPEGTRLRVEPLDTASRSESAVEKWSWSPLDSSRASIRWSGIDSAMELELSKAISGWRATGTVSSVNDRATRSLHVDVHLIACPSPAT